MYLINELFANDHQNQTLNGQPSMINSNILRKMFSLLFRYYLGFQISRQNMLLFILLNKRLSFSMKHTVQTQNYATIIDIPVDKLYSRCNHTTYNPQEATDYRPTVTSIPTCFKCCCCSSQKPKNNQASISISEIEQLEKLYEKDVKALNDQIGQLKSVSQKLKIQLAERQKAIEELRSTGKKDKVEYESQLARIQGQKKQLNNLLLAKVQQFERNLLTQQKNYGQEMKEMRGSFSKQIEELVFSNQNQISKIIQEKDMTIDIHKGQFDKFKESCIKSESDIITKYEEEKKGLKQKNCELLQQNSKLTQILKSLQIQSQKQQLRIKELQDSLQDQKNKSLVVEQSHAAQLRSQIENYITRQQQIKKQYSSTIIDKRLLEEKYSTMNQAYSQFQGKVKDLTIILNQREEEIRVMKNMLAQREEIKNYEVKIERVVDRSEYIGKLEQDIQQLKYQIVCLKEAGVLQDKSLKDKQEQIMRILNESQSFRRRVEQLNAYIIKRQKSFEWIAQKEILKDLEVIKEKGEKATYKLSHHRNIIIPPEFSIEKHIINPVSKQQPYYEVQEGASNQYTGYTQNQSNNQNYGTFNEVARVLGAKMKSNEEVNQQNERKVLDSAALGLAGQGHN